MFQRHLQDSLNGALQRRSLDRVYELLEAGADPNFYPERADPNEFPMSVAVRAEFISGLEALSLAGARINTLLKNGMTPLLMAATYGCMESGRWLLQHGANVYVNNKSGDNVLSVALAWGRIDFLEMVLQEQPRINNREIEDAARKSIYKTTAPVAQWLLKQGVSPNLTDLAGNTWLGLIQSSNQSTTKPMTELLLVSGADVNLADKRGNTPLHLSLRFQDPSLLLQLLHAGANPDLANDNGETVRKMIMKTHQHPAIRNAFVAWSSGQAAQQAIDQSSTTNSLRPL